MLLQMYRQYEDLTESEADLARHIRLGAKVEFKMEQRSGDQNQASNKVAGRGVGWGI